MNMNLDITNINTFEDIKTKVNEMTITDDYGENFSMYDMINFNLIGDKMYELKIKCAWDKLDVSQIVSELENRFPEIKELNISSLFDKEKYPKYIRTDIVSLLKDNLPFNQYLKLSDEIDKYWNEDILSKIKVVEESFEEISNQLEIKLQKLENFPKVMEAFNLFDKIKEEVMELSSQKLKEWKENDYNSLMKIYYSSCKDTLKFQILQQIKENLFKRLEEVYPIIFKEVSNLNGITDEKIIDTLRRASGVNKEMIKFSITTLFMSQTLRNI